MDIITNFSKFQRNNNFIAMNEIILYSLLGFSILSLCFPITRHSMVWNVTCVIGAFISAAILLISMQDVSLFDISFALLPYFTLHYSLDLLGLKFIVLLTGLWILSAIYAWSYLSAMQHSRPYFFMFFYNGAVIAAIAIALSANLQTMFVHYELLTIITAPLIAEVGTEHAEKSLKVYLGYLLFASLALFLPAIVIIQTYVGNTDFIQGGMLLNQLPAELAVVVFVMLLYGVAKTALMPFHGWLPAAMVAYHPVSALLHAVAVVNVGIFCVMRVVHSVFGIEYLNAIFSGMHHYLILLPFMTVIGASIVSLKQDTIKRLLAYSTISQLSMVLLALLSFSAQSLQVAFIFMIMHSINKIGLFFSAGNIYIMTRYTKVSQFIGLYRFAPHTVICFTLLGLSLIGIPPLAGFWAKYGVIMDAADLLQDELMIGYMILAVIITGSLFTAWYIMSVVICMFDQQSFKEMKREWQESIMVPMTHPSLRIMQGTTYVTAFLAIIAPFLLLL